MPDLTRARRYGFHKSRDKLEDHDKPETPDTSRFCHFLFIYEIAAIFQIYLDNNAWKTKIVDAYKNGP